MKLSKLALFSIAAIALASTGCASMQATHSESDMKMSASDDKVMGSCMSMSHDDMMKNKDCMGMMKKMSMTGSDMQMMSSCKKMPADAMTKDQGCMSMMKMHPEMMKMSKGN